LQSMRVQAIGSGFTLAHVLFDVVDTTKNRSQCLLGAIISQIVLIGKCFSLTLSVSLFISASASHLTTPITCATIVS